MGGDGQSALQASLGNPAGVAVDVGGNLYIADSGNNRVRKVNAVTGDISTIAGTGTQSFSGDAGPADQAGVYGPYAVTLDGMGNLYVADVFHNRIREISNTQSFQHYAAYPRGPHLAGRSRRCWRMTATLRRSFTSTSGRDQRRSGCGDDDVLDDDTAGALDCRAHRGRGASDDSDGAYGDGVNGSRLTWNAANTLLYN